MRESFKLPFGWRPAALFLTGWTLLGLTFASLSYAIAASDGRPYASWLSFPKNLGLALVWACLSPLVFKLTRRFPIDLRPTRLRNLLVHVPSLLLFSAVHHAAYTAILWWPLGGPHGDHRYGSVFDFYLDSFLYALYANILIYTLVVFGAQAFLYYEGYRAAEAGEARLGAQLAESRLRVLKMQLHPHFLFNTLHSINSLVLEDPPGASRMIARLGDFLRLTLERSEHQLVTLGEEIEFLRCYLDIEQVRFQGRLVVEFDVEPAASSAAVPHLILQPIVENAIQHAVGASTAPGRIRVAGRRSGEALRLEVRDSGPGISPDAADGGGKGVGLRNVRARLGQLYGRRFRFELTNVEGGGLAVILEVPLGAVSPDGARAGGEV
ncbi:MAG TPA: histidine kinase [Pyrinomonadaceae bacterium]|jgi:signal transduction histidine kinase